MNHEKWLEARRSCITGTDIAALMGLSPYKTLTGVWLDKKGIAGELLDNENMYWGRELESVIAARYARDTGENLQKGEFCKDGIIGGTIDFYAPKNDKIIEIKTAGMRQIKHWGEISSEAIPEHYLCQVMWYLGLHKKQSADLAVLIAGNDYRVYPISFNQELFNMMRDIAEQFWADYIEGNMEPTPDGTNDYNAYLKQKYPFNSGLVDTPPIDIIDLCNSLKELKALGKKLDSDQELLEQKIKEIIGDLDGYKNNDLTVTWKKSKDSMKIDWQSVAHELKNELTNLDLWESIVQKNSKITEGSRRLYFKTADIK